MRRSWIVSKLCRPAAPLLLLSGVFVAAGGFVHLREWLVTYRHVPTSLPGAEVVRIGFVINAAVSAVLVLTERCGLAQRRREADALRLEEAEESLGPELAAES